MVVGGCWPTMETVMVMGASWPAMETAMVVGACVLAHNGDNHGGGRLLAHNRDSPWWWVLADRKEDICETAMEALSRLSFCL